MATEARNDSRLSIEECRLLLDAPGDISDDQLLLLRDQLYALAKAGIASVVADVAQALERLHPSDRHEVEERAAILEFDVRMPRVRAESVALAQFRSTRQPPKRLDTCARSSTAGSRPKSKRRT